MFVQYLEHRINHYAPHTTFKRFLVSKNKRQLCDLFDDARKGLTQFPRWENYKPFVLSVRMLSEDRYVRLQEIR